MEQSIAGLVLLVAATLSACAQDDNDTTAAGAPPIDAGLPASTPPSAAVPTTPGTAGTAGPTGTTSTQPGTSAPATPTPEAPEQQRLGDPFTFASGLKVRVDRPSAFIPSAFVPPRPGSAVRLKVVMVNTGDDSFNPRHLTVTVESGGQAGVQIFDGPNQVVARSEKRLSAGRSVSFFVGFWVADPDAVVVGFRPGKEYATVTVVP